MSKRWLHGSEFLTYSEDSTIKVPHPFSLREWVDDMKLWPDVSYVDIVNFFILREGVDGEELRNYKSTEAYNYLHSNKIGKILCKREGDFVFLKAEVEPSQSLNKPKHQAWVMMKANGVIETAGCCCIAGLGKSCSHAAAIIWKVQNAVVSGKTGIACTDEQRRWNEGTSKNLEPKPLSQINFRHHKAEDEYKGESRAVGGQLPSTPLYQTHQEFRESVHKSQTKPLFLLKNTLLEKCNNATPSARHSSGTENRNDVVNDQPHQSHDSSDLHCLKCKAFYQAFISIDDKQAETLEFDTRGQSTSDLWHSSRTLRITASSAKKVPVRPGTNSDKFLREHIYPTFRGNYATNYGKDKEATACNQLKEQGINITHTGTVVSAKEPWLSASPDGIIDSCELLEIKCPVPNKNCSLIDLLSQRFSDVKVVDGKLELQKNGNRGYYMQVQLGMLCTGMKLARLMIWTPDESVVLNVQFDEVFAKEQVKRLRAFYFTCMLPRLVDDFVGGRLKLEERYLEIMRKV